MACKKKIDWSLHGEEIVKQYVCGSSVRDIIKNIKKKHGTEYKSGTLTNFLGRRGVLRSQSEAHALIRAKRKKRCQACDLEYSPTSYNQKWCDTCTGYGKYKRRVRAYGLTAQNLECMLQQQNSSCKICCKKFDAAFSSDRGKMLYVDHDHSRGTVRGLVCLRCNLGLSFIDKADWLNSALKYVNDSR